MKVGGWQLHETHGTVRCELALRWEDRDHPDSVAWVEWPAEGASALVVDAQAALLAAYPLALWHGERRLQLDGEVCPRLADHTRTAMALLAEWVPGVRAPALEVTERPPSAGGPPVPDRVAALCLSGGVDALAALQANRAQFPPGHAARYRAGIFAFGLNSYDIGDDGRPRPERLRAYQEHGARLAQLAEHCGLRLVRVASNLRSLYPSFEAWGAVAHASPLAAFGHILRRQVRSLAIANAGAGVGAGIVPHPLLDPWYSSHDLDVHAVHATLPRLEKVRALTEWPEALSALRVCYLIDLPPEGERNCGRCEKCLRTMVQLLAVGGDALARAPFPTRDVTPHDLQRIRFDGLAARIFFREVLPALEGQGRDDLAAVIRQRLARDEPSPATPETVAGRMRRWWRGR